MRPSEPVRELDRRFRGAGALALTREFADYRNLAPMARRHVVPDPCGEAEVACTRQSIQPRRRWRRPVPAPPSRPCVSSAGGAAARLHRPPPQCSDGSVSCCRGLRVRRERRYEGAKPSSSMKETVGRPDPPSDVQESSEVTFSRGCYRAERRLRKGGTIVVARPRRSTTSRHRWTAGSVAGARSALI